MSSNDPDEESFIAPNHILLGRSSSQAPNRPFAYHCSPQNRHKFIQQVVDLFWKRWQRYYFSSMTIKQKWHTEQRNMRKGDIVLLKDANAVRCNWKLARVAKVFPSNDDIVRRVQVEYKNIKHDDKIDEYDGKRFTRVERAVQTLVVILPVEEQ